MTLVTINGKATVTHSTQTPPPSGYRYVGWRGLHEIEGGRVIAENDPDALPAVIPPLDAIALNMTREIQEMSYALMLYFCPELARTTWRNLHRHDKAMTNKPQNGYDGGQAHADYINNRDTSASLPRYDKMQRTFQGTFIRADKSGDVLIVKPGIHAIDSRKPLPSIQTIVDNNWYMFAVNTGPENNPTNITHFAQGNGKPIVYPFILDREMRFNADFFERWESDSLPDPIKTY